MKKIAKLYHIERKMRNHMKGNKKGKREKAQRKKPASPQLEK